jgi:hypothetical protein
MLAKFARNPSLSLLIPGIGKFTLMPDTLTLMLDAMFRHCDFALFIAADNHQTTTLWPVIS